MDVAAAAGDDAAAQDAGLEGELGVIIIYGLTITNFFSNYVQQCKFLYIIEHFLVILRFLNKLSEKIDSSKSFSMLGMYFSLINIFLRTFIILI